MTPRTHPADEHSRLTVGIVTYNSADHIGPCLESVRKHLSDAVPIVYVLDNASSDKTLSVVNQIKKKFPFPLEILSQETNHGYARGANRICELARTDWICLINPDARLLTPIFESVRAWAKKTPTCGVIGGIQIDPEGNPQECGGVFPDPSMAVWDWCGLRKLMPRKSWTTTLEWDLPPDSRPRRIDYPTGAFWIFRREVFTRVGLLDDRFFLYFEETDFCKRAFEKGWPSYIHPAIRIEHHRGASFPDVDDPDRTDPLNIYFESLIKYLYKHFPATKVNPALWTIGNTLKLRRWIRKDEKSERILEAFEAGVEKAEAYERSLHLSSE